MRWWKTAALFILAGGIGLVGPGRLPAGSDRLRADHAGDRLHYRATWNGIPVAEADLLLGTGPARHAMELRGRAETNQALDVLWRMRDSFEATVATDPPGPDRFLLRQHENGRRRETSVSRDRTHGRLVGVNRRRGHVPRVATIALHRRLHDPASVAYLIRSLPEDLKTTETYEVFTGTKTYTLTVTPAATETVDALGRTWQARKLRLALRLAPIGESTPTAPPGVQEADLWISSGPERMPLRLQGRTFWGWVTVELVGRAALAVAPAARPAPPPVARPPLAPAA